MSNRLILGFKIVCAVLGVLLVLQLVRFAAAKDPLANVTIPTPPILSVATNVSVAPKTSRATNAAVIPTTSGATNIAASSKAPPKVTEPPVITNRIEQIKNTEIFGAAPKPPPMALLGIIGMEAIIRADNGQTGLVKEGDVFAGVKVLRLGTNRVLVEHEGEKKELTVFAGFGSETLMPSGKETVP